MAISPRLAISTIVMGVAYFGLAILGWGSFAGFFSHPARVALVIVFILLTVVALFSEGNISAGEREDRANRWVLAAFGVIGFLSAYLAPYTERREFWTFDGDTVRWLGVALFAAGGVLRLWPVFVLGRRFSGLVAIQPGHTLVTTGARASGRRAGLGAGVSLGGRRAARRVQPGAAHRAHQRRGAVAAQ